MARRRPPGDDDAIRLSNPLGFLQIAAQRLEDAEFLFKGGRTTASVYLAGYAIECALKSLILMATPANKRVDRVRSFRGNWAHDFEELKATYLRIPNTIPIPRAMFQHLSRASGWGTELRYQHTLLPNRDAKIFLEDAESIVEWISGRVV